MIALCVVPFVQMATGTEDRGFASVTASKEQETGIVLNTKLRMVSRRDILNAKQTYHECEWTS